MDSKTTELYRVRDVIRIIRNQRVILDAEMANPRSQFATLDVQHAKNKKVTNKTPFSETPFKSGHNVKYLPYAFTEHGAAMAAMILNSPKATQMSVFIVRTFIRIREQLLSSTAQAKRFAETEKTLLTHDSALIDIYEQIQPLRLPPTEPERKRIGFNVKEKQQPYRTKKTPQAKPNKETTTHA